MNRKNLIAIFLALILGVFLYLKYFRGESLAGVDANRDGIRDDVEKLIEEKYASNPKIRSAARQYARTLQDSITHPENTDEKPGLFAVDCLHYIAPDQAHEIVETLEAASANTFLRAKALIKESTRFNGKILEGAATQAEACSFDPALTQ